jgi:predicted amidophosphoribosyltransferase
MDSRTAIVDAVFMTGIIFDNSVYRLLIIEYVAAATIIIALLLLIRRRKKVCVRCAAQINSSDDACPRCGVPHPYKIFKVESRNQALTCSLPHRYIARL